MKKFSFSLLAVSMFCVGMPAAFAAEAVPTTNQPDNGFFEGQDPEWSTLHSTDTRGTPEHRTYHRDAVKAHFAWHAEHKESSQGASAYRADHRISHQLRNLLHRQFHGDPINP